MGSRGTLKLDLLTPSSLSDVTLWSKLSTATKRWSNATVGIAVRNNPFKLTFSARTYGQGMLITVVG